eukprot:gene15490-biopygen18714
MPGTPRTATCQRRRTHAAGDCGDHRGSSGADQVTMVPSLEKDEQLAFLALRREQARERRRRQRAGRGHRPRSPRRAGH